MVGLTGDKDIKIKFIEKEQDFNAEATIYWFDCNGIKYGVLECGVMDGVVIDSNKNTVNAHDVQYLPTMADLVTEEMRQDF